MTLQLLVRSISENIPTNLANFLGHHNSILLKNIGFSHGNTIHKWGPMFILNEKLLCGRLKQYKGMSNSFFGFIVHVFGHVTTINSSCYQFPPLPLTSCLVYCISSSWNHNVILFISVRSILVLFAYTASFHFFLKINCISDKHNQITRDWHEWSSSISGWKPRIISNSAYCGLTSTDWQIVHGQTIDLYDILCSTHCVAISTTGNISEVSVESTQRVEQRFNMMWGKGKHDEAWWPDQALHME